MWRQNLQSLQCDAAHIPLASESVDLIVTSPPYFALRDYREAGQSLKGQVGNEPTPWEFLDSLWKCTEEWMRVLKPRGSIFVNLNDKWAGGGGNWKGNVAPASPGAIENSGATWGFRNKSLMNLPHRYAIGCTDKLGLIQREDIVWDKVDGMPESAKDRCRRAHEYIFHFTKQGDYYSAIDRIREEHKGGGKGKTWQQRKELGETMRYGDSGDGASGAMTGGLAGHPAGKLPSSVWAIHTQPLTVPSYVAEETLDGSSFDFDHFAAYPPELVQKIIAGWSPKDVCTKCGQGRFPVSLRETSGPAHEQGDAGGLGHRDRPGRNGEPDRSPWATGVSYQIIGNACACTPYTDHPERRSRSKPEFADNGHPSRSGGEFKRSNELNEYGRGPVREYHLDQWEPAPSVPGKVLDPFGGTGTTAITAAKMARQGITCDLSFDCAKPLVDWRTFDLSQNRRKK